MRPGNKGKRWPAGINNIIFLPDGENHVFLSLTYTAAECVQGRRHTMQCSAGKHLCNFVTYHPSHLLCWSHTDLETKALPDVLLWSEKHDSAQCWLGLIQSILNICGTCWLNKSNPRRPNFTSDTHFVKVYACLKVYSQITDFWKIENAIPPSSGNNWHKTDGIIC